MDKLSKADAVKTHATTGGETKTVQPCFKPDHKRSGSDVNNNNNNIRGEETVLPKGRIRTCSESLQVPGVFKPTRRKSSDTTPTKDDQGGGSDRPTTLDMKPTVDEEWTQKHEAWKSTNKSSKDEIDATPCTPPETSYKPDSDNREYCEAVMPVEKNAEEYNMNHIRRGKAMIFNHDEFKNQPPRPGSTADVSALQEIYKALGFEVIIHNNLKLSDVQDAITGLAEEDHSDADCVLVTVLTHGESSKILHAHDFMYNVEELWLPFTANQCRTLAGKPKVFIIQACRGDKLDPGVTLKAARSRRTETDSSNAAYKIPTHADFLIAYSSVEGYYAWRQTEKGTWFIQSLCKELQEHASTKDFLKILTNTSRRVAIDHESYDDMIPWQHQQKQVPSFNSMLIRDLYFRPKIQ